MSSPRVRDAVYIDSADVRARLDALLASGGAELELEMELELGVRMELRGG